MSEENVAANTESVATSQPESAQVVTPETTQATQTEDVTQTQAFAQRLKEATTQTEQRAKDQLIAEMYGESHGIKTHAEYQAAIQREKQAQEAQRRNIDPEFYSEFSQVKDELSTLRREKTLIEQDNTLANDPKVGTFYKQFKNDIHDMAKQFNTDYDTALTVILRDRLDTLVNGAATQAEQSAVEKLTQNAQSTPGSLGAGAEHKTGYSSLSNAEKAKLRQSVLRGDETKLP